MKEIIKEFWPAAAVVLTIAALLVIVCHFGTRELQIKERAVECQCAGKCVQP